MAKATKKSGESKKAARQRRERVFEPLPAGNKLVVGALGVLGAMAMGAGVYGQFVGIGSPSTPLAVAPWILAGGAVFVGAAIWFGWSGDPVLRVGDAGIATDKGGLRRIAWHSVERVTLVNQVVKITGHDENDQPLTITAPIKSQPQAAAWIVRETRSRIPSLLELDDPTALPAALKGAGEIVLLDAIQVVGKKCAASGKIIAYEPDARVCPKCDLVYHKAHAPDVCTCGAPMRVKPKDAEGDPVSAELTKDEHEGEPAAVPGEKAS